MKKLTTSYTTALFTLIAIMLLVVPALSETRTTPTTLDPSGNTVKIDSTANTVKIDSSANTVKVDSTTSVATTTKYKMVQLWTTNQVVASGGHAFGPYIDCSGYKEIRFVIGSSMTTYNANLRVIISAYTPTGGSTAIANADFGQPVHFLSEQANLTPVTGDCVFSMPVFSNAMTFQIYNTTGAQVTMLNWSYAYLVN